MMSDASKLSQRKTVCRAVGLTGRSLATGENVSVTLHPTSGSGILFRHLPSGVEIPGTLEHVADVPHCTALERQGVYIEYVEHLMAVLAAHGITDLVIEVSGDQLPLLDGSAAPYEALIERAEPITLSESVVPIQLTESVMHEVDGKVIIALPGNAAYWYLLDHPHPLIGRQAATFRPDHDNFARQVAPARTFSTEEEARGLIQARGLEGAEETMAIIAFPDRLSAPEPFANSFAMHKIIDLMGDLYLLGCPLRATVIAFRTGHKENRALARAIGLLASAGAEATDLNPKA